VLRIDEVKQDLPDIPGGAIGVDLCRQLFGRERTKKGNRLFACISHALHNLPKARISRHRR
jgi:hypothetical protein